MPLTPHAKDTNRKDQLKDRAKNPLNWGVGRIRAEEIAAIAKGPISNTASETPTQK